MDETFFPEFQSGLIWIQTVFANVNKDRKRERDWYMHILSGKSKCIDRSTSRERERERERDVCYFLISSFFNSENSSMYFIFAKNSDRRDTLLTAFAQMESKRKVFWFSEGRIHR